MDMQMGQMMTLMMLNAFRYRLVDVCLGDSVMFTATPYFPYEPGGDTAATFGAGYDQTGNHTLNGLLVMALLLTQNIFGFPPPARVLCFFKSERMLLECNMYALVR